MDVLSRCSAAPFVCDTGAGKLTARHVSTSQVMSSWVELASELLNNGHSDLLQKVEPGVNNEEVSVTLV